MHKKNTFIMLLITILLSFVSCESQQTTSSLILKLKQDTLKSILPEDIPLEVTQFTITGKGPLEDDYFNINIKDNETTIKGLTLGTWDLFAVGKNIDGLLLVSGSTTVEIDKNPTSAEIELNKLVGNGNIKINFIWNPEYTNNP